MFDRIDQPPSAPLYPMKKRQAGPSPSSAPRYLMAYTSMYAPLAAVSEHRGAGQYVPAPSAFWGDISEHNTVPPSHANNSGTYASRSPPGRVFPSPHPIAIMPESSSCPPGLEGGSGGLELHPSRRGPINRYSRRNASHPANAFNVERAASGKGWTQQSLYQPLQ